MKTLQINKAIDGNLKPVKDSDGTLTALEVSTDNARVKNDLDIGGNAKLGGDISAVGDITTSGDATAYNLTLNGTKITTKNASFTLDSEGIIIFDSSDGEFRFLDANDTSDFAKIIVAGGTGETTLETVGLTPHLVLESGANGNMTMDSSGDLTLDSHNGNFISKKAGTEFSAANSAYAGMILGYTAIGIDASRADLSVGSSMATTDADHKVTFVAPPSGKVEIEIRIQVITTSVRQLRLGLSDNATYAAISFPNATDVTNQHNVGDIQVEGYARNLNHKWVVEGLTAGTSYTWWLGARAEQAGRITLWWGGDGDGEYPPFIMKATALPATIYTG